MKITNRKNETAESLIRQAKNNITKKLSELKNSESPVFKEFKEKNPELLQAISTYTSVYNKLKKVETNGLLEEFTVASKNLIKSFNFSDMTKDNGFFSCNYSDALKSPLYLGMEAIFDASLFKEQGKQRLFENIYNLQRTITKISPCEYFFYVKPYVYYTNAVKGEILRYDTKVMDFTAFAIDFFNFAYAGEESLYYCGALQGVWHHATYDKKSGSAESGVVYKYINFSTVESREEHGDKTFYMPAHQVIVLCWYGLNILKFCLGSGSILTIDHYDEDSKNNSISNLAVLTRVSNVVKSKTGKMGINFIPFFEVCGFCQAPFDYQH